MLADILNTFSLSFVVKNLSSSNRFTQRVMVTRDDNGTRSCGPILAEEFPARLHFVVNGRHSVFNPGHSLHQPHHCLPVREVGYAAGRAVALGADAGDVGRRIVFRGRCPAAHDVLYPADPLAAVVGEDYHHGPVAPGLVEEGHECRVGLQGSLPLPVLPLHAPYVPGVAVAQPAGGTGWSVHTKKDV